MSILKMQPKLFMAHKITLISLMSLLLITIFINLANPYGIIDKFDDFAIRFYDAYLNNIFVHLCRTIIMFYVLYGVLYIFVLGWL